MTSLSALDSPDLYTIAWIAALPIERDAAEAMFDEKNAAPTGSLDTKPTRTFIRGVTLESITSSLLL